MNKLKNITRKKMPLITISLVVIAILALATVGITNMRSRNTNKDALKSSLNSKGSTSVTVQNSAGGANDIQPSEGATCAANTAGSVNCSGSSNGGSTTVSGIGNGPSNCVTTSTGITSCSAGPPADGEYSIPDITN